MTTLAIPMPDTVATEYFDAADELNKRFGDTKPRIQAQTLMAFVLARHDTHDVCAQFDLALRLVQPTREEPFNPVLK
jgi:hypothetical protein